VLLNKCRFRGGLVFKSHRLFVSLNSRLESNNEEEEEEGSVESSEQRPQPLSSESGTDQTRFWP